jgi:hypothetical protein
VDLLSIVQALWRHKLLALPVILLTLLGAFYVVEVKAPEYQVSESLLLLSPPGPPSASEIAANPRLGKINANNPYVDLGLPVAADAVVNVVTAPTAAQELVAQGADPRYTVALSTDFGAPPILQITGTASSAAGAIKTATLVSAAAQADLRMLQKNQGVANHYLINNTELVAPRQATRELSGTLRSLIAVLALGAILLFVVISFADVVAKRRKGVSTELTDERDYAPLSPTGGARPEYDDVAPRRPRQAERSRERRPAYRHPDSRPATSRPAADRVERTDRTDRTDRTERPERPERTDRTERPERRPEGVEPPSEDRTARLPAAGRRAGDSS